MANHYSTTDLLNFLEHADERGLMPAATALALAVAVRNVSGVLSDAEKADVRSLNLDAVLRRFANRRARDFTQDSLAAYGRRFRRAIELFTNWRANPATFAPPTRAPKRVREGTGHAGTLLRATPPPRVATSPDARATDGVYQTAFPLRPGHVVTLSNLPEDLSAAEADKLAQFVRMLATD